MEFSLSIGCKLCILDCICPGEDTRRTDSGIYSELYLAQFLYTPFLHYIFHSDFMTLYVAILYRDTLFFVLYACKMEKVAFLY